LNYRHEKVNHLEVKEEVTKSAMNPISLTISLIIAAFLILVKTRWFPNLSLWVDIGLYFLIDIGFIIALIMGIRTKHKPIIIFSIIANAIFFIFMTIFVLLLAFAMGISEP